MVLNSCDKCSDWPGWVYDENNHVKRCECWIAKVKCKKLKAIPRHFKEATFKNYRNPPLEISNLSKSYFITGHVGKGKTHLLCAQYRAITEVGYFNTKFIREVDLIEDLQKQAYEKEHMPILSLGELSVKDDFHLFIDDLGKTPLSEDRSYQIFKLIDLAYSKAFMLSITSNFSLREIEKRFDSEIAVGIARRIKEICQPVFV